MTPAPSPVVSSSSAASCRCWRAAGTGLDCATGSRIRPAGPLHSLSSPSRWPSEKLSGRIAEALGNPPVDPHGDPIPDADLSLPEAGETVRLVDADEGDRVIVQRIRHQGDAELRYLSDAGVRPGAELVVVDVAPFGMVTVETPAADQSLPAEIAQLIEVETAVDGDAS